MSQLDQIRRFDAADATLKKFRGKLFDWGSAANCGAMLRFHLKKLGHAVPPMPAMRTAIGARAALKGLGADTMEQLLTDYFKLPAIAPAQMKLGDLVVAASAEGLGSVFVCAGHGAIMGWTEDTPNFSVWIADLAQFDRAFEV